MNVSIVEVPCAVCGSLHQTAARVRVNRDEHAEDLGLPGGRSSWVVCDQCGLVFQSPRPNEETLAALYDDGTYHEARGGVPEHYVAYSLRRSQAPLDWMMAHSSLARRRGTAVDIGCGIGGALVHLRDHGWDVQGVEPDPQLAAVARNRFDLPVRTEALGADSLPGVHADFAYSCHVWEHLLDPVATSRIAHRLLVHNRGLLGIVVPTYRRSRNRAWVCFNAAHTYMFSETSLRNVLELAGFEVLAHRFHAGADSELWMLARASAESHDVAWREDPVPEVQRELARLPLRAPLGLPGRAVTHLRTLCRDPRDFTGRLLRRLG